MNKKTTIVLLVLSHLLCILLGYCIAKIQLDASESNLPIEITTAGTTEMPTAEIKSPVEEETIGEEPVFSIKETEAVTESKEAFPSHTQPPTIQPIETEPSASEAPDIDVGENGTPIL